MKDEAKTKKQLIDEIQELRKFVGEILNEQNDPLDLTNLSLMKEAFRQMKKNQEMYVKAFIQNALPMGLTNHRDGCFVDVNDTFLRLSGFKRNEVIGSSAIDLGLVTSEQRAAALNKLNNKGRVENLEMPIRMKNGQNMQGLLNVVLMTLGKEKYRLIVVADVTDQHPGANDQPAGEPVLKVLPIDRPMPWFIG